MEEVGKYNKDWCKNISHQRERPDGAMRHGPLSDGLEGVIESCLNGETTALVPESALVEGAQVIFKKERAALITTEEADEILDALLELPPERVGHFDLLLSALNAPEIRKSPLTTPFS